MKTPTKVSPYEFQQLVLGWLNQYCTDTVIHKQEPDVFYAFSCKGCGSTIQAQDVVYSIHIFMDHCAGPGKVVHLQIPYCPKCEPVPDKSGCIHSPEFGSKFLFQFTVGGHA